jgi:hypothetical protein
MNAVVRHEDQPPNGDTLLAVISRAASDSTVDVAKMRELLSMYNEVQAKNAERQFNEAMNRAQAKIRRIAADADNPQTRSRYATYAKLDRVLRPIYIEEGFALSFDTGDAPTENCVRVQCYVSHNAGHSRTYRIDMPADGKGAKGNDVMTRTHAVGSGAQYGMRYLLKMIFNVAIGEDKDDDGNGAAGNAAVDAIYDKISLSQSIDELKKAYPEVEGSAGANKRNLIAAYNKRVRELKGLA